MSFRFVIYRSGDTHEFGAPPRFTVSARWRNLESQGGSRGQERVWEEDWKFEGLEECSGNADALTKFNAIREALHPDNFEGFAILLANGTVFLSRKKSDCYIKPQLDTLDLPSDGANAAWATNLRYSFTIKTLVKPSDSQMPDDELREEVSLRFNVDELGFLTVTESGKVSYSEPTYTPPRTLFALPKRTFQITRREYNWAESRTQCSYTVEWRERRFTLSGLEDVVGLNYEITMEQRDRWLANFRVSLRCRIPKETNRVSDPNAIYSKISTVLKTGKSMGIGLEPDPPRLAPEEFKESLPPVVKDILNKIKKALVPSNAINAQTTHRWNADSRELSVEIRYSVFKDPRNLLSFRLTYRTQASRRRFREFYLPMGLEPIAFLGGSEFPRADISVSCEALEPKSFIFNLGSVLEEGESTSTEVARFMTDGRPVYRTSKQYRVKFYDSVTLPKMGEILVQAFANMRSA